jgi:hypothetical protein
LRGRDLPARARVAVGLQLAKAKADLARGKAERLQGTADQRFDLDLPVGILDARADAIKKLAMSLK